jgi:hypothetical protein
MALLLAAWWGTEREAAFRWTVRGMGVFGLALGLIAFPIVREHFISQALYAQVSPHLTAPMEMAGADYSEPSMVWLFRKQIRGFDTSMSAKEAKRWMQRPGPRVCVVPAAELRIAFKKLDPAWQIVTARGWNVANARYVEVAAVIKD